MLWLDLIFTIFVEKNFPAGEDARIQKFIFKILIIGIIFSVNIDSFSNLSWNILVAVALHNLIGLFLGFLIASFFKFPMDVKKTVAIEVAMQNSGLGMTLALMHFTKLVALPSALFSLWHNISASGLVYFWKKK